MANTTLTQTGAQVQAILDKADKLPSSLGTAGQVLTMNAGATAPEWQTPSGGGGTQLYKHTIKISKPSIPPTSTLRIIVINNSNTPYTQATLIYDFMNASSIIDAYVNNSGNIYRSVIEYLDVSEELEGTIYIFNTGNSATSVPLDDTSSIESDTVTAL